tara:strand:+ start:471 stop:863 length:393 start_codon:yes stop_codon:yes gene_type:complete
MLVARSLAMVAVLAVAWLGAAPSLAQPSQQSLNATGQLIVDTIKDMCRQRHPDDEQEFRNCAVKRYDAMKGFFTKLYHYRDTMGIQSDEFKKGLACIESASPAVREQGRKVAVERADWIRANDCYESALR